MSKLPRPGLKLVETQAFTSPYLMRPVRSLEEVLANRQRRAEAMDLQETRSPERQQAGQAVARR